MQGVERIEHHSRRARAGERGGDLLANVPALADTDDDDLVPPPGGDRGDEHLHCAAEFPVETLANLPDGGHLDIKNSLCFFQEIHRPQLWPRNLQY